MHATIRYRKSAAEKLDRSRDFSKSEPRKQPAGLFLAYLFLGRDFQGPATGHLPFSFQHCATWLLDPGISCQPPITRLKLRTSAAVLEWLLTTPEQGCLSDRVATCGVQVQVKLYTAFVRHSVQFTVRLRGTFCVRPIDKRANWTMAMGRFMGA